MKGILDYHLAHTAQVHKAGLELEMGNGEGGEEGRGERGQGEVKHDWLIRITLESGHGLAIRDRTGMLAFVPAILL